MTTLPFQFADLTFADDQAHIVFANGYGIAVMRGSQRYASARGLYVLAVSKDGHVLPEGDGWLTNDLRGWLSEAQVVATGRKVEGL